MCSVVTAAILATIAASGATLPKPAPLPIAPGAEDIHAHAGEGVASVEYDVKDPYPSVSTIDYLMTALRQRGWKINDLGAPRSSGQTGIELPRLAHRWQAWWRDGTGNEVAFTLTSNCPMERYGMHSVYVHVAGVQYGKKEAALREAERQAERQRRAKETCAALRGWEAFIRTKECAQ